MQELRLLDERLSSLLKKYAAIEAENKRLKQTVAQQLQSIEGLNKKLTELEEKMIAVQIGQSVLDSSEKTNMRKQLDGILGEIDKILTTLND